MLSFCRLAGKSRMKQLPKSATFLRYSKPKRQVILNHWWKWTTWSESGSHYGPCWRLGCQWSWSNYNSSTNNLIRESPALWTKRIWNVRIYCSQKSLMLKIKSESFIRFWLGTLKKVRSVTWRIWKRRRWSFARASMDGRGKSSNSLKMKMLIWTDTKIKSLVRA